MSVLHQTAQLNWIEPIKGSREPNAIVVALFLQERLMHLIICTPLPVNVGTILMFPVQIMCEQYSLICTCSITQLIILSRGFRISRLGGVNTVGEVCRPPTRALFCRNIPDFPGS